MEALKDVDEAIKHNPNYPTAYIRRALIYEEFNMFDDYDLLRECWGYIEQVSARSQIYAGLEVQDQQYTVSVRFFHGLHIDCLICINGYYHKIDSIQAKYAKGQIIISCHFDSRINKNARVTT